MDVVVNVALVEAVIMRSLDTLEFVNIAADSLCGDPVVRYRLKDGCDERRYYEEANETIRVALSIELATVLATWSYWIDQGFCTVEFRSEV